MEKILGNLVHFKKNGEPGEPYPLFAGETVIGSHPDADIRLKIKNPKLEAIHCVVDVKINGTALLVNKSDRDPVRINGVVVRREHILKDCDVFEIAEKKFQYRKCISTSAIPIKPSTLKKRYSLFTSSEIKSSRSSLLAKTPQPKKTYSNVITKRLSKTVPRKLRVAAKTPKKNSTTPEHHSFGRLGVKPDIKSATETKPKSTSKLINRKTVGSSISSRKLSLSVTKKGSAASKSPLPKVSARNLILTKDIVNTPKILSTSLETSQSQIDLSKGTPENEVLSRSSVRSSARLSKTPKSWKKCLKATPKSAKRKSTVPALADLQHAQNLFTEEILATPPKFESNKSSMSTTATPLRKNSLNTPSMVSSRTSSNKKVSTSTSPKFMGRLSSRSRRSIRKSHSSSRPSVLGHTVSEERKSSQSKTSTYEDLSGLEELFTSGNLEKTGMEKNTSHNEESSLSESNSEEISVSSDHSCHYEKSLSKEEFVASPAHGSAQRSSGRVKKIPRKYDDTIHSLTPNCSVRLPNWGSHMKDDSLSMKSPHFTFDVDGSNADKEDHSSPQVLPFEARACYSTPHNRRKFNGEMGNSRSSGKRKTVSFIQSTPIPKLIDPRASINACDNSSVRQAQDGYSQVESITPVKETSSADKRVSRCKNDASNIDFNTKLRRQTRTSLTLPSSPLDSLIVNLDSESSLISESVLSGSVKMVTPTERRSSLRNSKIPTITITSDSNMGTSANDSPAFTTPENNVSVIEISDIVTTPNSPVKSRRSKSLHVSLTDVNTTPTNIPQEDRGFKTPLTTPALFESLKKSALRSRKQLNNSVVKSIRMSSEDDGSPEDDASSGSERSEGGKENRSSCVTRLSSSGSVKSTKEVPSNRGVKRGRESSSSISRSSKKAKLVRRSGYSSRQSSNLHADSNSEIFEEDETYSNSSDFHISSIHTDLDSSSAADSDSVNQSDLSSSLPRQRRSVARQSMIRDNGDRSHARNTSLKSSPTNSSSELLTDEVSSVNEVEAVSGNFVVSKRKSVAIPGRSISVFDTSSERSSYSRKSVDDSINFSGIEKLMTTPNNQKSPDNVTEVKRLSRSARSLKSPLTDLSNMKGTKGILRTPKEQKSPRNDLSDVRGVKKLLKTPRQQKSPENDLTKVHGVKRLMRTPKQQRSPINDLTNIRGVKRLMRTPKEPKSPKNDLTNVAGVKRMFGTPRTQKSPKNDISDVRGVKALLKTPREQKSPQNDLTNVYGVKRLMKTPKRQRSPVNDLTDVKGVKKLMQTPKEQKSPVNDLTNIRGVKRLMCTPKQQKSPANDLTDIRGVKRLMRTPKEPKSPKNDLTDVVGVKQMFGTSRTQKSPKNDLSDVRGVKALLKTPREQKSPQNDLTNVYGVKRLMRTPKRQRSPVNDLTDVQGVKKLMQTPKESKPPKNDLTDVQGVKRLYLTEEAAVNRRSANLSGIETLFQVKEDQNDLGNVDLFSNLHKKPLRKYGGKISTPTKAETVEINRMTSEETPDNSPHVEKWVEEQIKYISRQSDNKKDDVTASEHISNSSQTTAITDISATETTSRDKLSSAQRSRSKKVTSVNITDSPRRTTRRKQLVVELEPMNVESTQKQVRSEMQTDVTEQTSPVEVIKSRSKRTRKLYEVETESVKKEKLHTAEESETFEVPVCDLPKRTRRNAPRRNFKETTSQQKQSDVDGETDTSIENIPKRSRRNAKDTLTVEKAEVTDTSADIRPKRTRRNVKDKNVNEEDIESAPTRTRRNVKAKNVTEENIENTPRRTRRNVKTKTVDEENVESTPSRTRGNVKTKNIDEENVESIPKRTRRNVKATSAVEKAEEIDASVESRPGRTRHNVKDKNVNEEMSTSVESIPRRTRRNAKVVLTEVESRPSLKKNDSDSEMNNEKELLQVNRSKTRRGGKENAEPAVNSPKTRTRRANRVESEKPEIAEKSSGDEPIRRKTRRNVAAGARSETVSETKEKIPETKRSTRRKKK